MELKILVVQETDWLQNLPLQSHHIMEALSRRGHQITVVDFPAKETAWNLGESIHTRVFPSVHRTDPRSSIHVIRPGLVHAFGVTRLSSMLSQFKVIFEQALQWSDIIVLYSVPTNGLQAILSSKLASKPLIFHSFDVLHEMTGYDILRLPTWALERLIYRQADKVVVISSSLFQYMKDIGVPEKEITLLSPAIDIDRFSPQVSGDKFRTEIGVSNNDLLVLFSGWLYEFSGIDVLMNAMRGLIAEIPRLKLVVCGEGPLLTKLLWMRDSLSLQESVRIIGRRPYGDMPEIVGAADVCINPYLSETRSNFAFPSKLAEYMAAGKPVIASDLPGTRSMLGDLSGVVLVRPNELISSLKDLLLDKDKRLELGKKARGYCGDNFSLEKVTDKFESLLNDVLSVYRSS